MNLQANDSTEDDSSNSAEYKKGLNSQLPASGKKASIIITISSLNEPTIPGVFGFDSIGL